MTGARPETQQPTSYLEMDSESTVCPAGLSAASRDVIAVCTDFLYLPTVVVGIG